MGGGGDLLYVMYYIYSVEKVNWKCFPGRCSYLWTLT